MAIYGDFFSLKRKIMSEYYFFKIVFTKWQKFAQKNHSLSLLCHYKGFYQQRVPYNFLWCGFPICLFVFLHPTSISCQSHHCSGCISLVASNLQCLSTSSCNLEISRPTMLEPQRPCLSISLTLTKLFVKM